MSEDFVKVDPEALKKSAEKMKEQYKKCVSILGQMEHIIRLENGYWEGEAAQKFQDDFKKRKKKCEGLLFDFKNYPEQIGEKAGIYRKNDTTMQNKVDSINQFTME